MARILAGQQLTLFLQDQDFRYVWVANMLPVFGEVNFLGNTDLTSGLHESLYTKYLPIKQEVIRTGQPIHFEEWEVLPDGSPLFLSIAFEPYRFPNGGTGVFCRLIDLSGVSSDAASSTLAQLLDEKARELRELDDRFQQAMEGMPLLFYIQDENLNYVWVKNFVAVYNEESLMGRNTQDTGAHGEGYEQALRKKRQVIESGQPLRFDMWIDNPNGTRSFLQSTYVPYKLPNGKTGLMGKILDLTHQKLAEEKLTAANRQLSEKNYVIESQLEEARVMQLAMLPQANLEAGRFRLCADMQTCLQVGGDYYDYRTMACGNTLIALGDATGHGVRSGIIVSSVKAFFNLLPGSGGPANVLSGISTHLADMNLKQAYMGLSLLEIQPGQAHFAAGGMPPMLLYRKATGQAEFISIESLYLGTRFHGAYEQITFAYQPGDMAVMLTDGYTEMRNPEGRFITREALAQCVTAHAPQGCQAVVAAFKSLQKTYLGDVPLYDDSTIVAVEFK